MFIQPSGPSSELYWPHLGKKTAATLEVATESKCLEELISDAYPNATRPEAEGRNDLASGSYAGDHLSCSTD